MPTMTRRAFLEASSGICDLGAAPEIRVDKTCQDLTLAACLTARGGEDTVETVAGGMIAGIQPGRRVQPTSARGFVGRTLSMGWLYMSAACVFEIAWIVAMKYSDGFTRLWPTITTLVTSVVSFVLLAQAVRYLPVGTGYSVLNGVGTAGAVIFGIMFFGESTHPFRILCVVMIVAGVMGLKFTME